MSWWIESHHKVEVCVNPMLMIQLRAKGWGEGGDHELNRNTTMKLWLVTPRLTE